VTHRNKADVTVGGTAVARAIREVTVADERGTWKLTSFGEALAQCQLKQHRLRAARRSPRATVG
jgi:ribonuclease PH